MNKYTGVERFIFADVYNLFLKYQDMKDFGDYWQTLENDVKMLKFKYHNYPLAVNMLDEMYKHIKFKVKGTRLNGANYFEWEEKLGNYKSLSTFSTKKYKDYT